MIAATAIGMSVILLLLCYFDINEILSRLFPRPVIRGIQLSLGLILTRKGFNFILDHRFLYNGTKVILNLNYFVVSLGTVIGLIAVVLLVGFRKYSRFPFGMILICIGIVGGISVSDLSTLKYLRFGWESPDLIMPSWIDYTKAIPLLLVPQLPLTFANSILATTDAAVQYFGPKAYKVHPKSLFTSLGLANLLVGITGGIPVCHGSGGLTAHYRFGARSGGSSIIIGGFFIFSALILGKAAPAIFKMLPLAILGVMLCYTGISHTFLIKDIILIPWELSLVLAMGIITLISGNLALTFTLGTLFCHIFKWVKNIRPVESSLDKFYSCIEKRRTSANRVRQT
jgi:SulP family sulfate permease